MAVIVERSLFTGPDQNRSQTLLDFIQDYNPGPVLNLQGAFRPVGSSNKTWLLDFFEEQTSGVYGFTFFHDWFNRYHFIPTKLEIGNLLSQQNRTVILWNAYLQNKTLQSVTLLNAEGIVLAEPQPAPYVLSRLGTYSYVVTIQTEGPASINATIRFEFESAFVYDFAITGRRTVVWPFPPNWSSPVEETLEWLTYVETAFDGSEQRFAGRAHPRRVLEYTAQVIRDRTQLFESLMFGWSDRVFAVPLWQEKTLLSSDAASGAVALSLPTETRSFSAGSVLLLYKSPTEYEAVEIESVQIGGLALGKELESSWPAGTAVFPMMLARFDQSPISARYVAEDKLELPVRFFGLMEGAETRTDITVPPATYGGEELYLVPTNWRNGISVDFVPSVTVFDSTVGPISLYARAGWPQVIRTHEWLCKNRVAAEEVREFLARRRGRLTPAWVPSGSIDFVMTAPALAADNGITVRSNEYGGLVDGHPARDRIVIQLRGGGQLVRKISSYTDNGDGTAVLVLDAPLGIDLSPEQIRRISFLGLYRLASDAVTFSWHTSEVATVQTNFALTKPLA